MRARWLLLAVATLVAQRLLAVPGMPPWLTACMLPMVLLVAPRLERPAEGLPWAAIALGVAWDLSLEPVVGPGAIAWSAAAIVIARLASLIADRSPATWFAAGAVGAAVVVLVRAVAVLPLGIGPFPSAVRVAVAALLTGGWCGAVGLVMAMGLPARWRAWRARRLR